MIRLARPRDRLFLRGCHRHDDFRGPFADAIEGGFLGFDSAVLEPDIAARRGAVFQSDGAGDKEGYGFGFGLFDGLAGFQSLIGRVKQFMGEFLNHYGEFRSGVQLGADTDSAAGGFAFGIAQFV